MVAASENVVLRLEISKFFWYSFYMTSYTITPQDYSLERFAAKVTVAPSGCWEWTSKVQHRDGYGVARLGHKEISAHRLSYALFVGPLIEGLTIDHLCRNRICVNPEHLEQVTRKENTLRGNGITAQQARKTECKWGHAFDEENTVLRKDGRACRKCAARRSREAYARRKGI